MSPSRKNVQPNDGFILVDTHCHLDHDIFTPQLGEILDSARKAGVKRFVVPGVNPGEWDKIAGVAQANAGVFAAFGIHPMYADLAEDSTLQQLASLAASAVAIGEIGLDPAYPIPMEIQERAFREQIRLAVDRGLPLLIHCRKVFQRVHLILKEEKAGQAGGIMHAFSGSVEMAREFIKLGFAIAISGTVTWNNAMRPISLARELPLDSLVLETDAPDLTPQRYRGEPNQPYFLLEVLEAVSRIRVLDPDDVVIQTTTTTEKILKF